MNYITYDKLEDKNALRNQIKNKIDSLQYDLDDIRSEKERLKDQEDEIEKHINKLGKLYDKLRGD